MEKDFLKQIADDAKSKKFGSRRDNQEIWYNEAGDCVHFQTMHTAVIRDRIDEYLTLYRSAEDSKPIGFQLKDVHALVNKHEMEMAAVSTSIENNRIVSIALLLVKALTKLPQSINRIAGYTEALKVFTKDEDQVAIPV